MALSQEQTVMLGLWRKALREGELELVLPTKSDALRMRFSLYNAMRLVRTGKLVDPELTAAAEQFSIRVEDRVVKFFPKTAGALMDVALKALGGVVPEAPKTAEEAEVEGSLGRLLQRLGSDGTGESNPPSDGPARPATPYYKR